MSVLPVGRCLSGQSQTSVLERPRTTGVNSGARGEPGGESARLSTGVPLLRLLHALLEQHLELAADLPGLAPEFVQEFALLVPDLAVGEDHPPQPGGLLGVDPAVRQ